MEFQCKLLSSLEKVFFDLPPAAETTSGTMLKNEKYSFQLAMWALRERPQRIPCRVEVESDLMPWLQVRRVDYVPSLLPAMGYGSDDDYISKTPGLFPDPLKKLEAGQYFELSCNQARALWFTVDPEQQITGKYPITIRIYTEGDELLTQRVFTLEILDAVSPELDIYNTGWYHGDCVSVLHNAPVDSEEYKRLTELYLQNYVNFGHNMILTSVFTLPLNTAVGAERPTDQLVEVTVENGQYRFAFERLKWWLDICRKHGIRYFEIGHLFTQWGAMHAPKVMATVDGVYKRIFGWDTDAAGVEYKTFLDAFLPALIAFLDKEDVLENCFFHVSDEPYEEAAENYRVAISRLLPHIRKDRIVDALSSYAFYEKGIVQTPVVTTDHVHTFLENGVEDLWVYYCVAQRKDVANRFMAQPSYRNRVLGIQLYKSGVKGFLHWGYNFWFTGRSERAVDPYTEPDCGGRYPAGDAYVIYPAEADGHIPVSLRLHVFLDAMQDYRALKLLESLYDRETVLKLVEAVQGFGVYPRNSEYYVNLREQINTMIKKRL